MFFAQEVPEEVQNDSRSVITFSDGSPSVELSFWVSDTSPKPPASKSSSEQFFAWWESQNLPSSTLDLPETLNAFHAAVRLANGEALLVDTGAPKNISGSQWIERAAELAKLAGHGTAIKPLAKRMSVDGVGQNASSCHNAAVVPICMSDGTTAHFETPVITDSPVPALLGLESLERRRSIIDLVHGHLIELGPGGFKLNLPPGSKIRQLQKTPTGHLMLPCTAWEQAKARGSGPGKQVVFQTTL